MYPPDAIIPIMNGMLFVESMQDTQKQKINNAVKNVTQTAFIFSPFCSQPPMPTAREKEYESFIDNNIMTFLGVYTFGGLKTHAVDVSG